MKTLILFLALTLSSVALAEGPNGVGIVLGEPTGITFQHKINAERFMDFTFAYDWDDEEWMLMGDYKVHLPTLFGSGVPVMPYIGGGLFLHIEGEDKAHKDDVVIGLRIPFGVDWKVPDTSFSLFGEVAPGMEFIPKTDAEIQAGVGGRFFF